MDDCDGAGAVAGGGGGAGGATHRCFFFSVFGGWTKLIKVSEYDLMVVFRF